MGENRLRSGCVSEELVRKEKDMTPRKINRPLLRGNRVKGEEIEIIEQRYV